MPRFSVRTFGAGLLILAAAASRADTLRVGTRVFEGVFEGYENRTFLFRTEDGKLRTEPRSSVRRLVLDEPRETSIAHGTTPREESVLLQGYAAGKFTVRQDGRQRDIPGMFVRSVTLKSRLAAPAAAAPAEAAPAEAAPAEAAPAEAAPAIDVGALRNRAGLTAAQREAIRRYAAARKAYDAFVAQSSGMVSQLNSAAGQQRAALLDRLRRRKADEQPVKRELSAAWAALLKAFPDGLPAPPSKTAAAAEPMELRSREIVIHVPPLGENEVLFLDTGILEEAGPLSEAQVAAIRRYNKIKAEYEQWAGGAAGGDAGGDAAAMDRKLADAQRSLLRAFPNVKLVRE